jgi:small redox-active disulfide protein 2
MTKEATMATKKIEILGTGCPKCQALERAAEDAVASSGLDAEIVKVDQVDEIVRRGIMITPALAVDGVVKSSGRVLSADEIRELLA